MAYIIIKRTERDYREAADKAGLSRSRYSGLARSEEEAHELTKRRGGDKPDAALAFDDGGQADRELMRTAGISEEAIAKHDFDVKRARR
jgi:hypothetical protein